MCHQIWASLSRRFSCYRRQGDSCLDLVAVVPYLVVVRCPSCGNPDTRVIDSREAEDGASIRRRRVCDRCEDRFTTFERSESARIQVVKRDGARQEVDRRKLASAIGKGASKALAADEIDRLIDELEASLRQSGISEVPAQRIGELVLERLAERDPLGYLRFKIVYSRLEDIDALYDELASLVRRRQEARDRRVAEQIVLPIGETVPLAPRRRRRQHG